MRVNKPRNLRSTARYFSLCIIASCLFGIAAANVQAATITVTGNGDAVAVDGQCTLREAIAAANTNAPSNECPAGDPGPDVINFDAGAFATHKTVTLTAGDLVVSSELTINGTGAANLTISGNNASRVFFIVSGGTLTLDGLTITGGNTVGSFGNHGGAIEQLSGTLTITNSIVTGNSAELSGGGIHSQFSVLAIINSRVSGNIAGGGLGGGVVVAESTLTVTGSTVSGNSAPVGGGIYNGDGTVTVQRSTLSGNQGEGGAIYASNGVTNLTNTTVSGNLGGTYAGGIYYDGGTSTIKNSTIWGNAATFADKFTTQAATYILIVRSSPTAMLLRDVTTCSESSRQTTVSSGTPFAPRSAGGTT
jgi:CSLREA domain-containing protein